MNPAKIPAPGPYEVAIIIDEDGKARGGKGEKWILIRNADGAIATVYPAQNGEATAAVLASSWEMLRDLKLAKAVIMDTLGLEPADVQLDPDEKQMLCGRLELTIARAEARIPLDTLGRTK